MLAFILADNWLSIVYRGIYIVGDFGVNFSKEGGFETRHRWPLHLLDNGWHNILSASVPLVAHSSAQLLRLWYPQESSHFVFRWQCLVAMYVFGYFVCVSGCRRLYLSVCVCVCAWVCACVCIPSSSIIYIDVTFCLWFYVVHFH